MVSRAVAGLVLVTATAAHAEVVVYDKDGWTLSLDGRVNAYYSYEWGDYKPHFTPEQIAAHGGVAPTSNGLVWSEFTAISAQDPMQCNAAGVQANGAACTFSTSRVHSGFVGNLVGFTTKKKISDNLKATARVSLWWPIETDQYRGYSSMHPDPRESYLKLEGAWGGVLAGRALGLHDRGGTSIDFLYANGHSVGSPCSATGQGPLCGYIGYGYQFPSFNAGIIYNTPEASGFELAAGIYDPVRTGQQTVILETTPYPRVESEASYTHKGDVFFTFFVNGMWQQARGFHTDAAGAQAAISRNAVGASAGGRVEVAGFKLGVVGNWDVGGGDQSGLVGPVPVDNDGNLRTVKGGMGQLMYSLGKVDIAGGAGLTRVEQTAFDVSHHDDVIKTRLGASGTVTYHLDPSISLSAQYFHAEHTFWLGEIQRLNFVNTGLDFVW